MHQIRLRWDFDRLAQVQPGLLAPRLHGGSAGTPFSDQAPAARHLRED